MNYISYTTSKYWLPNILMYDCLLDKQLFYLLLKLKGILVNSYGIKTGYVWVTKDTPNTWQGNYGFIRYFCNRDRSILRSAQLAFDIKTLIWKFYLLLILSIVNRLLNFIRNKCPLFDCRYIYRKNIYEYYKPEKHNTTLGLRV